MERTKEEAKTYWNTRAKSFPGHRDGDTYQLKMLDTAKTLGVDFKGKTVLDIGCGTGAYALHIAKTAAYVTALDISGAMLKNLAADAKANGIDNIRCVESDWMDYETDDEFDIIFSSLTPAVGNAEAIEKISGRKGSKVVNIAFASPIKAYVLKELFKIHGSDHGSFVVDMVMKEWLKERNIQFLSARVQGEWITLRTHKEMVDNCIDVLEAHSIKPDLDKIEIVAEKFKTSDGMYESKTGYDVEMIVWEVK